MNWFTGTNVLAPLDYGFIAAYLVGILGETLPPVILPALLLLICMGIAFATGTSFGTFAVSLPIAIPLAFSLNPDPLYIKLCLGAAIGGAAFGDHCSPVSDTSILTAIFTGSDLMDHISSQLLPALFAAALAGTASTIVAALIC